MANMDRKYQSQYGDYRTVVEIINMTGERDEIGGTSINSGNPTVIYEDKCSLHAVSGKELKWMGTTEQRVTHTCQLRVVNAFPILNSYHIRLKYEPNRIFAITSKVDSSNRKRTWQMMLEELPNKL